MPLFLQKQRAETGRNLSVISVYEQKHAGTGETGGALRYTAGIPAGQGPYSAL